jgi:hypothetical protein
MAKELHEWGASSCGGGPRNLSHTQFIAPAIYHIGNVSRRSPLHVVSEAAAGKPARRGHGPAIDFVLDAVRPGDDL